MRNICFYRFWFQFLRTKMHTINNNNCYWKIIIGRNPTRWSECHFTDDLIKMRGILSARNPSASTRIYKGVYSLYTSNKIINIKKNQLNKNTPNKKIKQKNPNQTPPNKKPQNKHQQAAVGSYKKLFCCPIENIPKEDWAPQQVLHDCNPCPQEAQRETGHCWKIPILSTWTASEQKSGQEQEVHVSITNAVHSA